MMGWMRGCVCKICELSRQEATLLDIIDTLRGALSGIAEDLDDAVEDGDLNILVSVCEAIIAKVATVLNNKGSP